MTIVNNKKKYIFIHIPKTCGQTIKNTINNDKCLECENLDYIFNSDCYDKTDKMRNPYHFTGKEIVEQFNINPDKYTIFTFVRNPYDRFYSLYLHIKRELKKQSIPIFFINITLLILSIIIFKYFSKKTGVFIQLFILIVNIILIIYFNYLKLSVDIFTLSFQEFMRENFECIYDIYYNYFKPQYLYISGININFIGKEENFNKDIKIILENIGENKKLKNKNINTLIRNTKEYKYINKFDNYTIRLVNKIYKKDFEKFGYNKIIYIKNNFYNKNEKNFDSCSLH